MARRSVLSSLGTILALGLVGGSFTASASGKELTLWSSVLFSELDGGEHDEDESADGVFTIGSLTLRSGGVIVLDVSVAEFDIQEELILRGSSAIRGPSEAPAVGPRVTIHVGKTVQMRGDASISVAGSSAAGSVFVCAQGIELKGFSSISAGHPGGTGGTIWLQASGRIDVQDASTLVSADGASGGAITLIACGSAEPAIHIHGTVSAEGSAGTGGAIRIEARKAGIDINGASPRLIARGVTSDGTIQLTAATSVTPNPPPADPPAAVTTDHPSLEPCSDCHFATGGDCDANGVPDEVDLATCGDEPGCDDCNLNGVLDTCDISDGESLDLNPADGAPDECSEFISGGCSPPSENWSCFDNWPLPGDLYPDDVSSAAGVYVTLGSNALANLDVDATIPTLRLLKGAILSITQTGLDGDLNFSGPAKVLNKGAVFISGAHTIGVDSVMPPMFTIGADGLYQKAAATTAGESGGMNAAVLRVSDLIIQGGSCESPGSDGGRLELDELMSLSAEGRVVLEGAVEADCNAVASARGGVSPPPKLNIAGSGGVVVTGNVTAAGRSNVAGVDPEPPPGTLSIRRVVEVSVHSDTPVVLGGDFDNQGTAPALFDWLGGGLALDGSQPQKFEVGGVDVGPSLTGFDTGADSNFSMGLVRIGPSAHVTFVNQFANIVGDGACDEALYVRDLVFEPGAAVTLGNARVYYRTLMANGVTPTLLGCGELAAIPFDSALNGDDTCHSGVANLGTSCNTNDDCGGSAICGLKSRYLTVRVPTSLLGGVEEETSIRVEVVSIPSAAARAGEVWWAGAEQAVANTPLGNLRGAALECTSAPHSQIWTTGELHLWGAIIVPKARYAVRVCDKTGTNCSAPLFAETGSWGNVIKPFDGSGEPNFADIAAIAEKFRNVASAPITPRTDLEPAIPNGGTSFLDVSHGADAFRGLAYPFPLPVACP